MHDALPVALILLGAAVAVVVLFRRLSMPAILGYLLVGAVIGPNALGVVSDTEDRRYLAEFGVVFLMFSVGLEFSLPQLMGMRRMVFGLGSAQVILVMGIVTTIAHFAGLSWQTGLVLGGVLAMSSTAIVSKWLSEAGQLQSPHGRMILGVLLFQDLAVIPLLILIPALGFPPEALMNELLWGLIKAAIVLAIVLVVGQKVMRPLFHLVARQKSSELFVLFVLFVALGLAYVTEHAGLSLALGAFLAGMLISETEYRYQVEDYIKPFRDVLLGLFFVTIGMLLDIRAVIEHFVLVGLVLVGLLVMNFGVVYALGRAFDANKPSALRAALALAPAGEFAFVLLALASKTGGFDPVVLQVVLAASLLSMLLSPVLLTRMERIVLHFVESEWTQRAMALHTLAQKSMATRGHVIVCGYGRSGQALARFLAREKLPVIALDSDPERVRQAAAAGDSVVYGDASRREVLVAAAISRATAVVVSFADTPKALAILEHVREIRPELPVVVRTFDDSDVRRLKDAGAAEVVAEVVEGSLMLATQTMLQVGLPFEKVLETLRSAREERYQLVPGFFHGATDEGSTAAGQERLRTMVVVRDAACCGKAISTLSLPRLGVTLTSMRRPNVGEVTALDEERLREGDVLVLMGSKEALAKAEIRLLQG
ncbi:potassium transporter [Betaproteobacteria bacterium GR16-43]|nr:potassium transporter [Betaproteobacteria bacterium GR16-43]